MLLAMAVRTAHRFSSCVREDRDDHDGELEFSDPPAKQADPRPRIGYFTATLLSNLLGGWT